MEMNSFTIRLFYPRGDNFRHSLDRVQCVTESRSQRNDGVEKSRLCREFNPGCPSQNELVYKAVSAHEEAGRGKLWVDPVLWAVKWK
jgi:hypothetical protein